MHKTFLWSDPHLGHERIINYGRPFKSVEDHDKYILDTLSKFKDRTNDKIILLGDVAFKKDKLYAIREAVGNTPLEIVLGNHDAERDGITLEDIILVFDKVHPCMKKMKGGFMLTHVPAHPEQLRGMVNVHGHIHDEVIKDPMYINVCVEWAPEPVLFSDIREGKYKTFNR